MMRPIALFLLLLVATPFPLAAEEEGAVEAQLREALRNTMLQLREAQAKTAEMEGTAVQAEMAAAKAKKETAAVQAQLVDERNNAANQTAELRAAMTQVEDKAIALGAQVAKWEKRLPRPDRADPQVGARAGQSEGTHHRSGARRGRATGPAGRDEKSGRRNPRPLRRAQPRPHHAVPRTIHQREPAALQTIMQDLETRVRATGLPRPPSPPATAPAPAPSNQ